MENKALYEYQIKTVPKITCHSNKEKLKMKEIVKMLKGNQNMFSNTNIIKFFIHIILLII